MVSSIATEAPPYLSAERLDALEIAPLEVVERIEALMLERAAGRAWSAPKSALQPADGRYVMSTLAACDDPPVIAVKSLLLNPRNPGRGQPLINSIVTLQHAESGAALAVLDGNWVTAVRTAGLSAVAARRLARAQASRVAFIGCGVQARAHLDAFAALFPLRAVAAFGRGRPNIDALCERARAKGLRARACATAREALQGADLVVSSVTHSPGLEPFVDARWLERGAFAAITDLGRPWIASTLDAFDRIVIDDVAQEALMPSPMVDPSRVSGDVQGLVTGAVPGRREARERTAFIFRGMAIGDLALAALAWQRATGDAR